MKRTVDEVRFVIYVSVLFSEPKIPQYPLYADRRLNLSGFSALQRAENSSIIRPVSG